ncbi:EamA family transporter [Lactobacillus sp. LC28-10]|uniref:EamA family transporter n=1 Tax=Secundilactobacillus angelensis TaxID=2722706 RepID=A0ABX1KX99_9LACO|nr:EamA family transporter [Secundilactobacillus angelensis]MCH5461562.1 EamA family transporter [Secundilactobacillus angelensis]NLR17857.1 EamA family transporter [Secundilactobacillus angelensis]
MPTYFLPLILTIVANTLYQLSTRGVSHNVDPFFSLMVTYGVALLGSFILYLVSGSQQSLSVNFHSLNWASITMGLSIIFVEFGYMLSYKSGAPIGSTAMTVNIAITLLLIPIGMLFLQESFTLRNTIGVILAVVAIYLLNS